LVTGNPRHDRNVRPHQAGLHEQRNESGAAIAHFSAFAALTLLKQEKTELSVKSKRLKARRDNAFLGKILSEL
jgi:hypothetical protein